jgi:hypothetical protein
MSIKTISIWGALNATLPRLERHLGPTEMQKTLECHPFLPGFGRTNDEQKGVSQSHLGAQFQFCGLTRAIARATIERKRSPGT